MTSAPEVPRSVSDRLEPSIVALLPKQSGAAAAGIAQPTSTTSAIAVVHHFFTVHLLSFVA
jgi:hypothetical protein